MKNVILPFILHEEVKNEIIQFANKSNSSFWKKNISENTINRFYCKLSNYPFLELNRKIEILKTKIFNLLEIKTFKKEFVYGNFIGINLKGGFVHGHRDPPFQDWFHTRVNFMIQKPENGGMPLIDGFEYNVNEGECWFNNATLWHHGSTVVEGNKKRIILSLGAYVNSFDFERVNLEILKN